jgi:hypothetical protein
MRHAVNPSLQDPDIAIQNRHSCALVRYEARYLLKFPCDPCLPVPCACAATPLLQSIALQDIEIAPRSSRGFFLVVHIMGYALGSCVVAIIGYFIATQASLGWRLLFAMGTLPAMAVLAITPWLYETPQR